MMAVRLAAAAGDAENYVGKAAQLVSAIADGLPVPDGYALNPALVDAVARGDQDVREAVDRICEEMPEPLAVRSSGIGEDGDSTSFAGQHATLLNLRGANAVIAAIEVVWQSG